jgi:hypothetical protein
MADENLAYEDLDFGFVVPAYKVDFIDKILINKRTVVFIRNHLFQERNKINNSTFIILNKAIRLNLTNEESDFKTNSF